MNERVIFNLGIIRIFVMIWYCFRTYSFTWEKIYVVLTPWPAPLKYNWRRGSCNPTRLVTLSLSGNEPKHLTANDVVGASFATSENIFSICAWTLFLTRPLVLSLSPLLSSSAFDLTPIELPPCIDDDRLLAELRPFDLNSN